MSVHLRLDEDHVDEQHHEVVLDVFIREALASWALREADAATEGSVVRAGVLGVETVDRERAFDADEEGGTGRCRR